MVTYLCADRISCSSKSSLCVSSLVSLLFKVNLELFMDFLAELTILAPSCGKGVVHDIIPKGGSNLFERLVSRLKGNKHFSYYSITLRGS